MICIMVSRLEFVHSSVTRVRRGGGCRTGRVTRNLPVWLGRAIPLQHLDPIVVASAKDRYRKTVVHHVALPLEVIRYLNLVPASGHVPIGPAHMIECCRQRTIPTIRNVISGIGIGGMAR